MKGQSIASIHRSLVVICAIGLAMSADPAASAQRHVVVNGKEISGEELDKLDRADCRAIPDGNYWLNRRSRTWGYAGERMVQGHIGDRCRMNKREMPKSRSIDAAKPARAGSAPDEVVKREEPITGTAPLLRSPGLEPEKP